MWAADNELTRGVNEILDVVVEKRQHLGTCYLRFHAWHQHVQHVGLYLGQHLLVVGAEVVVLCAHNDGVDAYGLPVVGILHRHLTLRVGAQIGHFLTLFSYLGQRNHQQVGQV